MIYTPDKWMLICIIPYGGSDPLYKVFATWSGGYLDADSWQLNSGIVEITEDKHSYSFHGYSGSEYACGKNSYGTTAYGASVLDGFMRRVQDKSDVIMLVLSEEDAVKHIESKLKENK